MYYVIINSRDVCKILPMKSHAFSLKLLKDHWPKWDIYIPFVVDPRSVVVAVLYWLRLGSPIVRTVSDILAKIDYNGPNLTFLTLEMTFRVNPHLLYFRTWLVSHQSIYLMQYIWAELSYYWIIAIIMGKWTKPDLYDLDNDLSNNSIKSISWQFINIIPKEAVYKRKFSKSSKTGKFYLFRTLIKSFGSPSVPSLGRYMPNINGKKILNSFWIASKYKMNKSWYFRPLKRTSKIIQPNPYFYSTLLVPS